MIMALTNYVHPAMICVLLVWDPPKQNALPVSPPFSTSPLTLHVTLYVPPHTSAILLTIYASLAASTASLALMLHIVLFVRLIFPYTLMFA